mmetsp:Transcript_45417/g.108405  ORF Transcript_45417/g.108405 Transcript_45417/m.108405 type:complete len:241 (+) Transcript_45417:561-1283(+)
MRWRRVPRLLASLCANSSAEGSVNPVALPSICPSFKKFPIASPIPSTSRSASDWRTDPAAPSAVLNRPSSSSCRILNSSRKSIAPSQSARCGRFPRRSRNCSEGPSLEASPLFFLRNAASVFRSSAEGTIIWREMSLSTLSTAMSISKTASTILSWGRRNCARAIPMFCDRFASSRITLAFLGAAATGFLAPFFFFSAFGSSQRRAASSFLSIEGTFAPFILWWASQTVPPTFIGGTFFQ